MTCNIAQLTHPNGRNRFLWKVGDGKVAILRYDAMGTYTGSSSIDKMLARITWNRLVEQGWTRLPSTAIGECLTPTDMTFVNNLS